jgi:hypothetical protein
MIANGTELSTLTVRDIGNLDAFRKLEAANRLGFQFTCPFFVLGQRRLFRKVVYEQFGGGRDNDLKGRQKNGNKGYFKRADR